MARRLGQRFARYLADVRPVHNPVGMLPRNVMRQEAVWGLMRRRLRDPTWDDFRNFIDEIYNDEDLMLLYIDAQHNIFPQEEFDEIPSDDDDTQDEEEELGGVAGIRRTLVGLFPRHPVEDEEALALLNRLMNLINEINIEAYDDDGQQWFLHPDGIWRRYPPHYLRYVRRHNLPNPQNPDFGLHQVLAHLPNDQTINQLQIQPIRAATRKVLKHGLKLIFKEQPRRHLPKFQYIKDQEFLFERWLKEAESKDLIEKGYAEVTAPTFFIPRTNDKVRMIYSCTYLNDHLNPKGFRLPRPEKPTKFKYFCKIDLSAAYYHIRIHERDRKYLGMTFKGVTYRWKVLPMGLNLSPYFFQYLIMDILRECKDNTAIYYDDILIGGMTYDECLQMTQRIMTILDAYSFEYNKDKCILTPTQKIEFLGFIISNHKMRLKTEQLQKIKRYLFFTDGIQIHKHFKGLNEKNRRLARHVSGYLSYYLHALQLGWIYDWWRNSHPLLPFIRWRLTKILRRGWNFTSEDTSDSRFYVDATPTAIGFHDDITKQNKHIPVPENHQFHNEVYANTLAWILNYPNYWTDVLPITQAMTKNKSKSFILSTCLGIYHLVRGHRPPLSKFIKSEYNLADAPSRAPHSVGLWGFRKVYKPQRQRSLSHQPSLPPRTRWTLHQGIIDEEFSISTFRNQLIQELNQIEQEIRSEVYTSPLSREHNRDPDPEDWNSPSPIHQPQDSNMTESDDEYDNNIFDIRKQFYWLDEAIRPQALANKKL